MAEVAFPAPLEARADATPEVAKIVRGKRRLFGPGRAARQGQASQFEERIAQLPQEVEGPEAERQAMSDRIRFIGVELKGVEQLYAKTLVTIARVGGCSARRRDGLTLLPRMSVEAHIRAGERTVLSYLLKPLSTSIARATREGWSCNSVERALNLQRTRGFSMPFQSIMANRE